MHVECPTCSDLNKTPLPELLSKNCFNKMKIFKHTKVGPYLPNWCYVPHKCLFSNLVFVQNQYLCDALDVQCFDSWMSINGGPYQLGKSGKLQNLWDDRLKTNSGNLCMDPCDQETFKEFDLTGCHVKIVHCNNHKAIKHVEILRPNNKNLRREKFKILNKLFPHYDEVDKKHCNIDLASLVNHSVNHGKGSLLNLAFKYIPIGIDNTIACSLIIHYLGNHSSSKLFMLMKKDKACCMNKTMYKNYFKAVSIAIRRTSLWPDNTNATLEEITACAAWELPLGRHCMVSDWNEEYHNRVIDYLPLCLPDKDHRDYDTNLEYLQYAKPVLDEIIAELIPAPLQWKSWLEFCESRNTWLTSGSAGAKYTVMDGIKVRLNRRAYMETISIEEMVSWMDDEPKISATGSEKYEMGKARAIYGTETKDQSITAYILNTIEPRLHNINGVECGLMGRNEMISLIRKANIAQRTGEECTMLDYSDFNRQHTLEVQSMVFKCIKERLMNQQAHPDVIRAAQWLEDAHLNHWIKFPHIKESVKVVQGLVSGNRATNFLNTILNVMYFRVCKKWITENLKIGPMNLFNLHHGDDVWISNQNRLWAMSLYLVATCCGLVFSDSKQIQDLNKGEFLRVVYTEEGARGYMARSIATLIERPLQSEMDLSPATKATGLNSQIHTCYRRGLDVEMCSILFDVCVKYALKSTTPNGSSVTVNYDYVCRRFIDGGLDLGPSGTLAEKTSLIPPIPVIQYRCKKLEQHLPQYTTESFIKTLSEGVKTEIRADAVREVIHMTNIADSLPQSSKVISLINHHKDIELWKLKVARTNPKPCLRNYVDLKEWAKDEYDPVIVEQIDMLFKEWPYTKYGKRVSSSIETILSAVASSPFKDIGTAKCAMNLNTLDATTYAISLCKNEILRSEAKAALSSMRLFTSDEVASRLLASIRGFGPAMEAWFNPVPLSLITNLGLQRALEIAKVRRVTTIQEWDSILDIVLSRAFKSAVNHDLLLRMSHY